MKEMAIIVCVCVAAIRPSGLTEATVKRRKRRLPAVIDTTDTNMLAMSSDDYAASSADISSSSSSEEDNAACEQRVVRNELLCEPESVSEHSAPSSSAMSDGYVTCPVSASMQRLSRCNVNSLSSINDVDDDDARQLSAVNNHVESVSPVNLELVREPLHSRTVVVDTPVSSHTWIPVSATVTSSYPPDVLSMVENDDDTASNITFKEDEFVPCYEHAGSNSDSAAEFCAELLPCLGTPADVLGDFNDSFSYKGKPGTASSDVVSHTQGSPKKSAVQQLPMSCYDRLEHDVAEERRDLSDGDCDSAELPHMGAHGSDLVYQNVMCQSVLIDQDCKDVEDKTQPTFLETAEVGDVKSSSQCIGDLDVEKDEEIQQQSTQSEDFLLVSLSERFSYLTAADSESVCVKYAGPVGHKSDMNEIGFVEQQRQQPVVMLQQGDCEQASLPDVISHSHIVVTDRVTDGISGLQPELKVQEETTGFGCESCDQLKQKVDTDCHSGRLSDADRDLWHREVGDKVELSCLSLGEHVAEDSIPVSSIATGGTHCYSSHREKLTGSDVEESNTLNLGSPEVKEHCHLEVGSRNTVREVIVNDLTVCVEQIADVEYVSIDVNKSENVYSGPQLQHMTTVDSHHREMLEEIVGSCGESLPEKLSLALYVDIHEMLSSMAQNAAVDVQQLAVSAFPDDTDRFESSIADGVDVDDSKMPEHCSGEADQTPTTTSEHTDHIAHTILEEVFTFRDGPGLYVAHVSLSDVDDWKDTDAGLAEDIVHSFSTVDDHDVPSSHDDGACDVEASIDSRNQLDAVSENSTQQVVMEDKDAREESDNSRTQSEPLEISCNLTDGCVPGVEEVFSGTDASDNRLGARQNGQHLSASETAEMAVSDGVMRTGVEMQSGTSDAVLTGSSGDDDVPSKHLEPNIHFLPVQLILGTESGKELVLEVLDGGDKSHNTITDNDSFTCPHLELYDYRIDHNMDSDHSYSDQLSKPCAFVDMDSCENSEPAKDRWQWSTLDNKQADTLPVLVSDTPGESSVASDHLHSTSLGSDGRDTGEPLNDSHHLNLPAVEPVTDVFNCETLIDSSSVVHNISRDVNELDSENVKPRSLADEIVDSQKETNTVVTGAADCSSHVMIDSAVSSVDALFDSPAASVLGNSGDDLYWENGSELNVYILSSASDVTNRSVPGDDVGGSTLSFCASSGLDLVCCDRCRSSDDSQEENREEVRSDMSMKNDTGDCAVVNNMQTLANNKYVFDSPLPSLISDTNDYLKTSKSDKSEINFDSQNSLDLSAAVVIDSNSVAECLNTVAHDVLKMECSDTADEQNRQVSAGSVAAVTGEDVREIIVASQNDGTVVETDDESSVHCEWLSVRKHHVSQSDQIEQLELNDNNEASHMKDRSSSDDEQINVIEENVPVTTVESLMTAELAVSEDHDQLLSCDTALQKDDGLTDGEQTCMKSSNNDDDLDKALCPCTVADTQLVAEVVRDATDPVDHLPSGFVNVWQNSTDLSTVTVFSDERTVTDHQEERVKHDIMSQHQFQAAGLCGDDVSDDLLQSHELHTVVIDGDRIEGSVLFPTAVEGINSSIVNTSFDTKNFMIADVDADVLRQMKPQTLSVLDSHQFTVGSVKIQQLMHFADDPLLTTIDQAIVLPHSDWSVLVEEETDDADMVIAANASNIAVTDTAGDTNVSRMADVPVSSSTDCGLKNDTAGEVVGLLCETAGDISNPAVFGLCVDSVDDYTDSVVAGVTKSAETSVPEPDSVPDISETSISKPVSLFGLGKTTVTEPVTVPDPGETSILLPVCAPALGETYISQTASVPYTGETSVLTPELLRAPDSGETSISEPVSLYGLGKNTVLESVTVPDPGETDALHSMCVPASDETCISQPVCVPDQGELIILRDQSETIISELVSAPDSGETSISETISVFDLGKTAVSEPVIVPDPGEISILLPVCAPALGETYISQSASVPDTGETSVLTPELLSAPDSGETSILLPVCAPALGETCISQSASVPDTGETSVLTPELLSAPDSGETSISETISVFDLGKTTVSEPVTVLDPQRLTELSSSLEAWKLGLNVVYCGAAEELLTASDQFADTDTDTSLAPASVDTYGTSVVVSVTEETTAILSNAAAAAAADTSHNFTILQGTESVVLSPSPSPGDIPAQLGSFEAKTDEVEHTSSDGHNDTDCVAETGALLRPPGSDVTVSVTNRALNMRLGKLEEDVIEQVAGASDNVEQSSSDYILTDSKVTSTAAVMNNVGSVCAAEVMFSIADDGSADESKSSTQEPANSQIVVAYQTEFSEFLSRELDDAMSRNVCNSPSAENNPHDKDAGCRDTESITDKMNTDDEEIAADNEKHATEKQQCVSVEDDCAASVRKLNADYEDQLIAASDTVVTSTCCAAYVEKNLDVFIKSSETAVDGTSDRNEIGQESLQLVNTANSFVLNTGLHSAEDTSEVRNNVSDDSTTNGMKPVTGDFRACNAVDSHVISPVDSAVAVPFGRSFGLPVSDLEPVLSCENHVVNGSSLAVTQVTVVTAEDTTVEDVLQKKSSNNMFHDCINCSSVDDSHDVAVSPRPRYGREAVDKVTVTVENKNGSAIMNTVVSMKPVSCLQSASYDGSSHSFVAGITCVTGAQGLAGSCSAVSLTSTTDSRETDDQQLRSLTDDRPAVSPNSQTVIHSTEAQAAGSEGVVAQNVMSSVVDGREHAASVSQDDQLNAVMSVSASDTGTHQLPGTGNVTSVDAFTVGESDQSPVLYGHDPTSLGSFEAGPALLDTDQIFSDNVTSLCRESHGNASVLSESEDVEQMLTVNLACATADDETAALSDSKETGTASAAVLESADDVVENSIVTTAVPHKQKRDDGCDEMAEDSAVYDRWWFEGDGRQRQESHQEIVSKQLADVGQTTTQVVLHGEISRDHQAGHGEFSELMLLSDVCDKDRPQQPASGPAADTDTYVAAEDDGIVDGHVISNLHVQAPVVVDLPESARQQVASLHNVPVTGNYVLLSARERTECLLPASVDSSAEENDVPTSSVFSDQFHAVKSLTDADVVQEMEADNVAVVSDVDLSFIQVDMTSLSVKDTRIISITRSYQSSGTSDVLCHGACGVLEGTGDVGRTANDVTEAVEQHSVYLPLPAGLHLDHKANAVHTNQTKVGNRTSAIFEDSVDSEEDVDACKDVVSKWSSAMSCTSTRNDPFLCVNDHVANVNSTLVEQLAVTDFNMSTSDDTTDANSIDDIQIACTVDSENSDTVSTGLNIPDEEKGTLGSVIGVSADVMSANSGDQSQLADSSCVKASVNVVDLPLFAHVHTRDTWGESGTEVMVESNQTVLLPSVEFAYNSYLSADVVARELCDVELNAKEMSSQMQLQQAVSCPSQTEGVRTGNKQTSGDGTESYQSLVPHQARQLAVSSEHLSDQFKSVVNRRVQNPRRLGSKKTVCKLSDTDVLGIDLEPEKQCRSVEASSQQSLDVEIVMSGHSTIGLGRCTDFEYQSIGLQPIGTQRPRFTRGPEQVLRDDVTELYPESFSHSTLDIEIRPQNRTSSREIRTEEQTAVYPHDNQHITAAAAGPSRDDTRTYKTTAVSGGVTHREVNDRIVTEGKHSQNVLRDTNDIRDTDRLQLAVGGRSSVFNDSLTEALDFMFNSERCHMTSSPVGEASACVSQSHNASQHRIRRSQIYDLDGLDIFRCRSLENMNLSVDRAERQPLRSYSDMSIVPAHGNCRRSRRRYQPISANSSLSKSDQELLGSTSVLFEDLLPNFMDLPFYSSLDGSGSETDEDKLIRGEFEQVNFLPCYHNLPSTFRQAVDIGNSEDHGYDPTVSITRPNVDGETSHHEDERIHHQHSDNNFFGMPFCQTAALSDFSQPFVIPNGHRNPVDIVDHKMSEGAVERTQSLDSITYVFVGHGASSLEAVTDNQSGMIRFSSEPSSYVCEDTVDMRHHMPVHSHVCGVLTESLSDSCLLSPDAEHAISTHRSPLYSDVRHQVTENGKFSEEFSSDARQLVLSTPLSKLRRNDSCVQSSDEVELSNDDALLAASIYSETAVQTRESWQERSSEQQTLLSVSCVDRSWLEAHTQTGQSYELHNSCDKLQLTHGSDGLGKISMSSMHDDKSGTTVERALVVKSDTLEAPIIVAGEFHSSDVHSEDMLHTEDRSMPGEEHLDISACRLMPRLDEEDGSHQIMKKSHSIHNVMHGDVSPRVCGSQSLPYKMDDQGLSFAEKTVQSSSGRTIETQTYPETRVIETQTSNEWETCGTNWHKLEDGNQDCAGMNVCSSLSSPELHESPTDRLRSECVSRMLPGAGIVSSQVVTQTGFNTPITTTSHSSLQCVLPLVVASAYSGLCDPPVTAAIRASADQPHSMLSLTPDFHSTDTANVWSGRKSSDTTSPRTELLCSHTTAHDEYSTQTTTGDSLPNAHPTLSGIELSGYQGLVGTAYNSTSVTSSVVMSTSTDWTSGLPSTRTTASDIPLLVVSTVGGSLQQSDTLLDSVNLGSCSSASGRQDRTANKPGTCHSGSRMSDASTTQSASNTLSPESNSDMEMTASQESRRSGTEEVNSDGQSRIDRILEKYRMKRTADTNRNERVGLESDASSARFSLSRLRSQASSYSYANDSGIVDSQQSLSPLTRTLLGYGEMSCDKSTTTKCSRRVTAGLDKELERLHQERQLIIDMLAEEVIPSRIQVELIEAHLSYLMGQTDALLLRVDEPLNSRHHDVHGVDFHAFCQARLEASQRHIETQIQQLERVGKEADMKAAQLAANLHHSVPRYRAADVGEHHCPSDSTVSHHSLRTWSPSQREQFLLGIRQEIVSATSEPVSQVRCSNSRWPTPKFRRPWTKKGHLSAHWSLLDLGPDHSVDREWRPSSLTASPATSVRQLDRRRHSTVVSSTVNDEIDSLLAECREARQRARVEIGRAMDAIQQSSPAWTSSPLSSRRYVIRAL